MKKKKKINPIYDRLAEFAFLHFNIFEFNNNKNNNNNNNNNNNCIGIK